MKCKFCREELPEGAKFCPVCGTPAEPETKEGQERDDAWDEAATGWQGENSYQYGPSNQGQDSNQHSSSNQGGNPYQYGPPNQKPQGQYQYGPSDQEPQGQYQYGPSDQEPQGQYQYGSMGQGNYQYGSMGQGENSYQYHSPNQGDYQYGPTGQGQYQNNSGAPNSGTPYMILAIFTVLMCCMPLGIVAIIYASRINGLLRIGDYAGARESAKKVKIFSIIGIIGGLITMTFLLIFNLSDWQDGLLSSTPRITVSERADTDEDESIYEDEEEPVEKASTTEPAEQSSELGETWDSYTVQINDKVLTFPCTYGELEAAGLTLDTSDTPEDYIVNANEYVMVFFEDANDNYVMADLINMTDNAKTIKECLVGGISVSDYGVSEGGITILFPGGLKIGSTREEMLEKYGNTDDIYEGDSLCIYTWSAENSYYSQCEMDLDAQTGLINSMNIQNYGE